GDGVESEGIALVELSICAEKVESLRPATRIQDETARVRALAIGKRCGRAAWRSAADVRGLPVIVNVEQRGSTAAVDPKKSGIAYTNRGALVRFHARKAKREVCALGNVHLGRRLGCTVEGAVVLSELDIAVAVQHGVEGVPVQLERAGVVGASGVAPADR